MGAKRFARAFVEFIATSSALGELEPFTHLLRANDPDSMPITTLAAFSTSCALVASSPLPT